MRTENVLELFSDVSLRQHIIDTAKDLTNSKRLQKALVGHAWFVLGETDAQKNVSWYKALCTGTMRRERDLYRYGEKKLCNRLD